MIAAFGRPYYVELRNRTPLRIAAEQINALNACGFSGGSLDVRGAPGVAPVIEIQMIAGKPFLATGSSTLALSGLDIQVSYPPTPAGTAVAPPPVISVAGSLTIDRCAFSVKEGPKPAGCHALEFKGKSLSISGCWFQGFGRAIQFQAFPGAQAKIDQTMIVPDSAPSSETEWRAWGVEVELGGGGGARKPHLILTNCTFEGRGLLDFVPGTVQSGLQVELKRCAVRADALLAWKPKKPGDRPAVQLQWSGEGNLFDIREKSWIVLSSKEGTPALSLEVTDLDSWSKIVGPETKPIRSKLTYRTVPARRLDVLRPSDFAVNEADLNRRIGRCRPQ